MRAVLGAMKKLKVKTGDVVIYTGDNIRPIRDFAALASRHPEWEIPSCPIIWLQPGTSIESVAPQRLQHALEALGWLVVAPKDQPVTNP